MLTIFKELVLRKTGILNRKENVHHYNSVGISDAWKVNGNRNNGSFYSLIGVFHSISTKPLKWDKADYHQCCGNCHEASCPCPPAQEDEASTGPGISSECLRHNLRRPTWGCSATGAGARDTVCRSQLRRDVRMWGEQRHREHDLQHCRGLAEVSRHIKENKKLELSFLHLNSWSLNGR